MLSMGADIYDISWKRLNSSWSGDISVKLLQQQQNTSSNIIFSLLWINSMSPDEMIEYLATQRKIIDALRDSKNQIMQHIPEQQWEANIIPLNLESDQKYKKVA